MLAITSIALLALGLAYVLKRNRRPRGIGAFRQPPSEDSSVFVATEKDGHSNGNDGGSRSE